MMDHLFSTPHNWVMSGYKTDDGKASWRCTVCQGTHPVMTVEPPPADYGDGCPGPRNRTHTRDDF